MRSQKSRFSPTVPPLSDFVLLEHFLGHPVCVGLDQIDFRVWCFHRSKNCILTRSTRDFHFAEVLTTISLTYEYLAFVVWNPTLAFHSLNPSFQNCTDTRTALETNTLRRFGSTSNDFDFVHIHLFSKVLPCMN